MTFFLEVLLFFNNLGIVFHLMSGIRDDKISKVLLAQLAIGIVLLIAVTVI